MRCNSLLFFPIAYCSIAFAATDSIGDLSTNLYGPVSVATTMMHAICSILGVIFLISTIVRYRQHRDNPKLVPFMVVVWTFLIGLGLVLFPIMAQRNGQGSKVHASPPLMKQPGSQSGHPTPRPSQKPHWINNS